MRLAVDILSFASCRLLARGAAGGSASLSAADPELRAAEGREARRSATSRTNEAPYRSAETVVCCGLRVQAETLHLNL
jgi:hypothetical protein